MTLRVARSHSNQMADSFDHIQPVRLIPAPLDIPSSLCLDFSIPRFLGVAMAKTDLQGTLDLLVLKTLDQNGALHGYGIVLHIQSASNDMLRVEEGSLYPALHRMEQSGWIGAGWGVTGNKPPPTYHN